MNLINPFRKAPRKPNPSFSLLPAAAPPFSPAHASRLRLFLEQRKPTRPPAGTAGSRRRGTWSGKARSSRRCWRSGWGEPPSPEPANTAAMVVTGALALVPAAAAASAHLRHNLRRHRQVLLHSRAPALIALLRPASSPGISVFVCAAPSLC
ncbi:hypothetical protein PVAP13_5KG498007 [Panicum virgatum]|uniref:Uncharacterized protein n=1 Tax=Panicum virgatum TaxID=38727 RepID=A0A8T0SN64_PANVG|nr:hypothetical protein PVAP13_5KG498007 [Panicum virgatum]